MTCSRCSSSYSSSWLFIWFCSLGCRHLGFCRHADPWTSELLRILTLSIVVIQSCIDVHPIIPWTSHWSNCNNSPWSHWNKWLELPIDNWSSPDFILSTDHVLQWRDCLAVLQLLVYFDSCCLCCSHQSISQVVPYSQWIASLGRDTTGLAYYSAKEASPHPSRFTSWNLLLHYDWMAELSIGSYSFLVISGVANWEGNRCAS